jgi:hypothetical protein
MADESDVDTSRAVVQTYVPSYQRDAWDEHAEKLEMSRSEFVKTMVQAGRREFGEGVDDPEGTDESNDEDLRDRVLDELRGSDARDWEDLLSGITGDIETRLDDTLQELQDTGRIRYSGRDGGYVLMEGSDE